MSEKWQRKRATNPVQEARTQEGLKGDPATAKAQRRKKNRTDARVLRLQHGNMNRGITRTNDQLVKQRESRE